MKTNRLSRGPFPWFGALALLIAGVFPSSASADDQPIIKSIHLEGTNIVVTAQVPDGIQRVTLECRSRLGTGTWQPRALTRLAGAGGQITFRIARGPGMEVLRVRADDREPLPASFYAGTNSFTGQPVGAGGMAGVFDGRADVPGAGPTSDAPSRDVVESDIWKIRGDTLYFFNQYRGLQILDISVPDSAIVTGMLSLPAAGEQMYLLDTSHVALLARAGCGGWGGESEGQVLIVNVSGATPKVAATLPVKGVIQESRLVGSALYVASESMRPLTSNSWEWGTRLSSFDLSNPEAPVEKDTLWFPGYGNVIAATDVFLFVSVASTTDYWRSTVHCLDITAPDGTMHEAASISTAGRVNDKFKMNWANFVFTVVSEAVASGSTAWTTTLETFHLPDPRAVGPEGVFKLGDLSLGNGERVYATRFDANLAYVVTFRRIDPLWVVDLADPAQPKIAGELHVPGYSTFIQPLGDRLVTVGIDDTNSWRVAVSLFDVHDPASPALLSKVALGQNSSWSEANSDEKAFNVMRDQNLILLPFQGLFTNGYASRVQLIDLNHDSLALRGTVDHPSQPRRATVHNGRLLSLSGQELLSVDARDRDHPQITATIPLAWSVDQVIAQGQFLIELTSASGWWWNGQPTPALRITPAGEPDQVLAEIDLPSQFPILGAAVRDGRLYLAQGQADGGPVPLADGPDPNPSPTDPAPNLFLLIYDVSALPTVKLLGQTDAALNPLGWSVAFQVVWPKAGVIVFAGGGGGYWNPWLDWGVAQPVGPGFAPIYWGNNGGRLIAFDVKDASAPRHLSDLNLATNTWWNFSTPFADNGLIFLSHEAVEPYTPVATDPKDTNSPPVNYWVQRSYLDVVDYADAANPTVRKPVNIPGALKGIGHAGELLYTVGPHWTNSTNGWYDGTEYLDASAYDGVEAHLIDSLALGYSWPHPVLVKNDVAFVGHPAETNTAPNLLESWTLSNDAKFNQLAKTELSGAAQNLATFGNLLAAQISNQVSLFDVADPAAPVFLLSGGPSGCLWFDLSKAGGAVDHGLWLPLGAYGVSAIPLAKTPSP